MQVRLLVGPLDMAIEAEYSSKGLTTGSRRGWVGLRAQVTAPGEVPA